MKISRVGLVANDSPRAADLALESAKHLKGKVEALMLEKPLLERVLEKNGGMRSFCGSLDRESAVHLILAFGGDGTILRAAREFNSDCVLICGVNMGRMGFLSQIEPRDLMVSLDRLLSGDYETCERMRIDVRVRGELIGTALNELLVLGDRIGKVFRGRVEVESWGELMLEGDGVIVSTPTGSTGHSLSAGGSVLDCELEAIAISPLAAMAPLRSVVVSADKQVSIFPGADCTLAIDGVLVGKAGQGAEIGVAKSASSVRFAVLDQTSFRKKLRQRIGG